MKALYDLKEMLSAELEEIARKPEMSAGDLETVHKLTDTIKNIDKICALEEDGGYCLLYTSIRGKSAILYLEYHYSLLCIELSDYQHDLVDLFVTIIAVEQHWKHKHISLDKSY